MCFLGCILLFSRDEFLSGPRFGPGSSALHTGILSPHHPDEFIMLG
jgi:hypothetical protein